MPKSYQCLNVATLITKARCVMVERLSDLYSVSWRLGKLSNGQGLVAGVWFVTCGMGSRFGKDMVHLWNLGVFCTVDKR